MGTQQAHPELDSNTPDHQPSNLTMAPCWMLQITWMKNQTSWRKYFETFIFDKNYTRRGVKDLSLIDKQLIPHLAERLNCTEAVADNQQIIKHGLSVVAYCVKCNWQVNIQARSQMNKVTSLFKVYRWKSPKYLILAAAFHLFLFFLSFSLAQISSS